MRSGFWTAIIVLLAVANIAAYVWQTHFGDPSTLALTCDLQAIFVAIQVLLAMLCVIRTKLGRIA